MEDIRVLCRECADTYRNIGYRLIRVGDFKDECNICTRLGFEYKLKKTKARGGKLGE